MTQATISYTEQVSGKERLSYEEFLRLPADLHAEWVDGEVVCSMTVSRIHDDLHTFLVMLLGLFLEDRPLGRLQKDPFQMKPAPHLNGRAPDIMFIANEHTDRLRANFLEGPADLAIEIVSPGNAATDYVDKFREYEAGGVTEYWIFDPVNQTADFFVLENGRYERRHPDAEGVYRSAVLSGFWLTTEWLWEQPPVRALLAEILAPAE